MEEPPLQTRPDWPPWASPRARPGSRRAWEEWHGRHHPGGQWHGPESGGELRRDLDNRLVGGVAAGVAAWRGRRDRVTAFRVVFVAAALITAGAAVPLYFIAWLLITPRGDEESIGARARRDSRGVALALGLASLLAVILLFIGALNGFVDSWGWPQVVSVGCLALIWRNASPGEQEGMRRLIEPLGDFSGIGGGTEVRRKVRRATVLRLILAIILLGAGLGGLLSAHESLALLRPLGGLLLVAAGIVLILGPWWFRIARDLVLERQARARAEERAEVASRVHDSVLQTLALIQRRSGDPAVVVALARAQERELRSWLFEGRVPGSASSGSFSDGVREIQQDVESRHGVPVEVVTVGDCPLDDDLSALLGAAREAVVNAAKWSGAPVISLFAEITAESAEVVVRDRGRGFDPSDVPGDRKGLAESIHGRMKRHAGAVTVQSAPGEGTKVSLTMPRRRPGPAAQPASGSEKGAGR